MICDKYEALSHPEKIQFIGKLVHAAQNDDEFFDMAESLIELAENKGLYQTVTILPNHPVNLNNNELPTT